MAPDPDPDPARRRRRRYYPRRRRAIVRYLRPRARRYRRGLFGRGLSAKATLAGSIGLLAMKRLIGENGFINLGVWNPPIQKVAAGAILQAARLDNADLFSAGVKEAVAVGIDNYLIPLFTGGFGQKQTIGGVAV